MHLAYVAGLFDGEGWFQIDRSNRKDTRRGVAFQLHARMALRQKDVLEEMQRMFGGSLRLHSEATEKHAAYWSWDACGANALHFAAKVNGFLLIKSAQAQLAIRFQVLKMGNVNQPCSDERFAAMRDMYEKMKVLNQKGPR